MKKILSLLIFALLLTGCSVTEKTQTSEPPQQEVVAENGSSFETAIPAENIPWEYAWLRENYPGHEFIMQSLAFEDGKPYDILEIKTADGETKEIYFDISSFFGKGL